MANERILLRRQLGHGGSATVFEAEASGFVLAAKIFHQHFGTDEQLDAHRYALARKLDALTALPAHDNVVTTFAYRFQHSSRLVVLMERMDDITLRDLIDQRRQLAIDSGDYVQSERRLQRPPFALVELLALFEQVVAAVAFLHHLPDRCAVGSGGHVLGVWHRDIKAENVFVKRIIAPLDEALRDDHFGSSSSSGRVTLGVVDSSTPLAEVDNSVIGARKHRDADTGDDNGANNNDEKRPASSASSTSLPSDSRLPSAQRRPLGQKRDLHRHVQLKLGDLDEAHIVYDINSPNSPIQWLESALFDSLTNESNDCGERSDNRQPGTLASSADICAGGQNASAVTSTPSPSAATSGRVRRTSILESLRHKTLGGKSSRAAMVERLSLTVGTPEFMAPEMADRGSMLYGERVDIWSLGMLLFELLTLELPYGCDQFVDFELLTAIANGVRPSFPTGYYNDAPFVNEWKPVIDLFVACTHLDPTRRPSAAALLRQVRTLIDARDRDDV